MDNQHVLVDSHELAWLAGYIECDGSIMISCHNRSKVGIKPQVFVTFCNTGEVMINRAAKILRSLKIEPYIRILRRDNRPESKILYQIDVTTQSKCSRLLRSVYPYLLYKKPQADLVLEFCESRIVRGGGKGKRVPYNKRELQLIYNMKVLNHKGTSQTEDHDLVAAINAAPQ